MALPSPFASAPPAISIVPGPHLWGRIDAIQKDPRFSRMGVMLVDMTTRIRVPMSSTPIGFNIAVGWNQNKTMYGASVVKIAAMFAAFRLLENIGVAARDLTAANADALLAKIAAEWKPVVEAARKGAPKDFPDLKKIFSVAGSSGGWVFSFQPTFERKMKEIWYGSLGNSGASYCILSLGYQYIYGALANDGLYTAAEGGIWLGGDYTKAGRDWIKEPRSGSYQAGSAAMLAKFLVLLESGRLVSGSASSDMRDLMVTNWMGNEILPRASRPVTRHYGKLGIGFNGSYHDAAVVERLGASGKPVRYAIVMLGARSWPVLLDLGLLLDELIVSSH